MYSSESIINNLLIEVDSLTYRLNNIKHAYINTANNRLRERLIDENKKIFERISEIFSIAELLEKRNNERITFASLLCEKCRRIVIQTKMKRDLFFL